jgi:ssDNA-binding Zn-finger/Zn-ribbon topoisomerase 1
MQGEYCPKCLSGKVIRKNGKYGDFLACDRYPLCDYVEKLSKKEMANKSKLEVEADEFLRNHGRADLIL